MNTLRTLMFAITAGALALAGPASASDALPRIVPEVTQDVAQVYGDCHAVGMRYAAQEGGQLARATAETRNGTTVCVVVVLLPARDGKHPQRKEAVLPLN